MTDPRNKLNDLTNTEWIVETKSVWYSRPPRRDSRKIKHPATFAETDIERVIRFFTKDGERVLDPFLGTGSTLIACAQSGRIGTGIELINEWADVSRSRLLDTPEGELQTVIEGDTRQMLPELPDESFEFVVTSPPYWMILNKDKDHKATKERTKKGLDTKYSDSENDLGNVKSYDEFLEQMQGIFTECGRLLASRRYMCIVVSDFRHKSDFVPYHQHICGVVEKSGFNLEGITILAQDSKGLYPYGMPYAFVSNIHHQYILVFRKNL